VFLCEGMGEVKSRVDSEVSCVSLRYQHWWEMSMSAFRGACD
jgi:hypothetical protein